MKRRFSSGKKNSFSCNYSPTCPPCTDSYVVTIKREICELSYTKSALSILALQKIRTKKSDEEVIVP